MRVDPRPPITSYPSMRLKRHSRLGGFLFGMGAAVLVGGAGCQSGSAGDPPFRGLDRSDAYAAETRGRSIDGAPATPPATVNGEPIEWAELHGPLAEAAGSAMLEEIALERLLAAEMAQRGRTVGEADIERERRLLMETLAVEGDSFATEQLVERVRERRGLGPQRFGAMLRRNAMLRALIADRVEVRPDQVELAWRVRHGERVRVRIIVTESEREAQAARRDVLAGAPAELELRFAAMAEERSTDASKARGGLVEAFSPEDPAYESSIRSAVSGLRPGEVSPIVAVRTGFALVYLDERVPADGVSLSSAAPDLREELRIRQERLLMDELAEQLLAEARITAFDAALRWSRDAAAER